MPKLSLPVRLALLVAGTTLPLILFAGGIVFHNYVQDRSDARQRVLDTVRSIRLTLDAEMQRMTGGVQVLALTDALTSGDFERFRPIALGFLNQYGRDGTILVADSNGRQLFSSTTTDTASLPPRNNMDIVERVFRTRQVQYSNLFFGAVKKSQIITVEVPVFRDGDMVYEIVFSPPITMFQIILDKQLPSADWTLSLLDRNGVVFARIPNPTDSIGKRASDSVYDAMMRQQEATLSTVSLDGVALMSSFTHSALTGWIIGAGIAEHSLVAPLWRNLAITSLIGGVMLAIGLAFAVRMATTIARGEMLHDLLIEELNHRVKNTLAILQAIAVQTFRSASRTEREKFEGRLGALAEAHNLLSKEKWQGSELDDVIARVLKPYQLNSPDRIRMSGPEVPLSPRLAVVLSMIVHEIATNAAKYGALSNDVGTVDLSWELIVDKDAVKPHAKLRMVWRESGGPVVAAPIRRGFGSRLIERSARDQLGGEATVDFLPRGVVYTITCAIEQ
ncbi:putative sensor histidine kinase [Bradyrhizobium sp. STM 3843]|uniref:sensor histidine kinase n=1 Tax=Bradyrhizobium sp. STM 3843 TaxID=551947 RepID=UPI00024087ED|nr:sensor histidine kinase [Bradyrhizobium sp. STM 3843]CCE04657.1 putative sensor histidine kinase [Bradyrhizobium sp. STM 3843]